MLTSMRIELSTSVSSCGLLHFMTNIIYSNIFHAMFDDNCFVIYIDV